MIADKKETTINLRIASDMGVNGLNNVLICGIRCLGDD